MKPLIQLKNEFRAYLTEKANESRTFLRGIEPTQKVRDKVGGTKKYIQTAGQFLGSMPAYFRRFVGKIALKHQTKVLRSNGSAEKVNKSIKPLIQLENASVVYQSGKANEVWGAKNVNFQIYPEEYIIFFGPSGSGKSTLLNLIAGLEKPSAGKVIIADHDISILKEQELIDFHRNTTGIIFQAFYLISYLSIEDNILLPQIFVRAEQSTRKDKLKHLAERFDISDVLTKRAGELSGGQTQRVAAARALINDPLIVLADEPVGNLDTKNAAILMELLNELNQKDKKTVILVTHDPRYLAYAHRVFYMKDGEIVKETRSPKKQIAPGSEKTAGASELEKMAQDFPYAEDTTLRAKLALNQLLQPYSLEDQHKMESLLEKYFKGELDEPALLKAFEQSTKTGGLGIYKQRAKDLVSKIAEIGLERKIVASDSQQKSSIEKKLESIRHFLLEGFAGELSIDQITRLDDVIYRRWHNRSSADEFRQALDLSFAKGGVGLSSRTARNLSRKMELILTGI